MKEEGLTGVKSIPELSRRYHAVLRGEIPCPAVPDCPDYQRALAAGKRFRWERHQLSFAEM